MSPGPYVPWTICPGKKIPTILTVTTQRAIFHKFGNCKWQNLDSLQKNFPLKSQIFNTTLVKGHSCLKQVKFLIWPTGISTERERSTDEVDSSQSQEAGEGGRHPAGRTFPLQKGHSSLILHLPPLLLRWGFLLPLPLPARPGNLPSSCWLALSLPAQDARLKVQPSSTTNLLQLLAPALMTFCLPPDPSWCLQAKNDHYNHRHHQQDLLCQPSIREASKKSIARGFPYWLIIV